MGLDPLSRSTIRALVSIVRGRLSQCLARVSAQGLASIVGLPLFQRPLRGYPLSESTIIELILHSGISTIPVSCPSVPIILVYIYRTCFYSGTPNNPVSCPSVPTIPVSHYRPDVQSGPSTIPVSCPSVPTIPVYHYRVGFRVGPPLSQCPAQVYPLALSTIMGLDPLSQSTIIALVCIVRGRLSQCLA